MSHKVEAERDRLGTLLVGEARHEVHTVLSSKLQNEALQAFDLIRHPKKLVVQE